MDEEERIDALRRRQKQLEAQVMTLEARQRQDRRKRDTRRKIVIGGAVLALARTYPGFAGWLEWRLADVVAPRDREFITGLGAVCGEWGQDTGSADRAAGRPASHSERDTGRSTP